MFLTLNEGLITENKYPVFIILTQGKRFISDIIRKATDSEWSHCSITLDPDLRYFHTYTINDGGFGMETRHTFMRWAKKINISVFFVNKETHNKIAKNISDYSKNKEKTTYSFRRLFEAAFNKGKENKKYDQVCSSFVQSVLSDAGCPIASKEILCVKPSDVDRTINNNKNYIFKLFEGNAIDMDDDMIKIKLNELIKSKETKLYDAEKIALNESLSPELVDRSKYDNFKLFNFFNIYTTDKNLKHDESFKSKMKWVKDKIDNICQQAGWIAYPYELTLCASFDDLDEFYDHKAPKWVTGFTYGDKVYMKAPSIYPGELYYNIVLHECIHVQIYLNEKLKGFSISREDEEGMAVFFSTPLNKWLKELNHGPNWYYYESAIRVQEDYLNGGFSNVKRKRFKHKKELKQ